MASAAQKFPIFSMSYASLPPVFQVRAKELDLLGKPPGVLYFSSSSSLIHPTAAGRSNLPPRQTGPSKIRLPIINLAEQFRDGAQAKRRCHFTFIPNVAFQTKTFSRGDLCRARSSQESTRTRPRASVLLTTPALEREELWDDEAPAVQA